MFYQHFYHHFRDSRFRLGMFTHLEHQKHILRGCVNIESLSKLPNYDQKRNSAEPIRQMFIFLKITFYKYQNLPYTRIKEFSQVIPPPVYNLVSIQGGGFDDGLSLSKLRSVMPSAAVRVIRYIWVPSTATMCPSGGGKSSGCLSPRIFRVGIEN